MKPLLVGEVNPYGSDPMHALYPLPENASGARLCRILGMTQAEYLRAFDRVNLCTGRWSIREARKSAARIRSEEGSLIGRRDVILLGRKVAEAFRFGSGAPFSSFGGYILLPHPSGRCLLWNVPENVEKARELLRRVLR